MNCSLGSSLPDFTVLHAFSEATNGPNEPFVGLVLGSDQVLYGTTVYGGSSNLGTIFKLNPAGSQFTVLHSFGGYPTDGQVAPGNDPASLTSSYFYQQTFARLIEGRDGVLYGTTWLGGAGGGGTVFKLHKDGTGYSIIRSFDFADINASDGGYYPTALVQASDGTLYGTLFTAAIIRIPGAAYGTVFRIQPDGTGYQTLYTFDPSKLEGPVSLIIGPDNALYGTARASAFEVGYVFRLNQDGSGFDELYAFGNAPSYGYYPTAGLLVGADGALYGTASYGGLYGGGTIFTLRTDGSGYTVLYDFGSSAHDGSWPSDGGLIAGCGEALYGTTAGGGSNGLGTVFTIGQDGGGYSILRHFSANDGAQPNALALGNGVIYGLAETNGPGGGGTIFALPTSFEGLFDPPTITGACCGTNVAVTVLSTVSSNTPCGQAFTRTWEVFACCVSNLCSQTVFVNTNGPVLTCSDITIACGTPVPTNPPSVYDPTCTNVVLSLIGSTTNGSGCGQTIFQTWQAVDLCCGTSNTCVRAITTLPSVPALLCSNLTLACGSSVPTNPPAWIDACCSNVTVMLLGSTVTNSGCSQTIYQTWQAFDQCCGTSNTCVRTITILPSVPTLLCTNLTIACGSPIPTSPPAVMDACCANLIVTLVGSTSTNSGCTQTVSQTWQAVDPCCVTSNTCVRTITITSAPPVVVCPPDIEVTSCTNIAVFFQATLATNGCCTNATLSYTPPSGSRFAPGTTNLVQCLATDCCGRTNSCAFRVIVLSPTLKVTINDNQHTITLTWSGGGVLLQADTVTGPWNPVPGAASPYMVPINKAAQFYRLVCQ